ncbi:origin recognition complex subunit 4 [Electrophorus electricus]|uniref:origin recognition complex subunit 4 n=1 Tax=Electrophorus electricus TaxID=8005 RepID=UPI0015D03BA5|nr:origin recognition complex subunit 4 [Electrophorus electricus]
MIMETEQKDRPNNTLAIGNINPSKRGRGRPRGSVNKKIMSVKEVTHNARASRRVDFFSPDTVLKQKVKKRGRPKKIKIPGRPRKIPLTPEEEAERILRFSKQRKRKISKPLGRPRIHPLVVIPKEKRGRGRPRKYEAVTRASSENSTVNGNLKKGFKKISEFGEGIPRKRGRPRGSFKKKRGRPAGSAPTKITSEWNPGKRGRPPGSGIKLKFKEEENGIPRKRGRPPGSGTRIKIIRKETDGTPRKRGRPPGSGNKVKITKQETNRLPRKRGRPPGSGTKIKVAQQEPNGASRKRGRPPGSGKSKTDVNDTDRDFSSSALSASDQPRKRGRPSKASSTEASSVSKAEVPTFMCSLNLERIADLDIRTQEEETVHILDELLQDQKGCRLRPGQSLGQLQWFITEKHMSTLHSEIIFILMLYLPYGGL